MQSVIINGKVHDYHYKKMPIEGMYTFYINGKCLGTLHKIRNRWSAVPSRVRHKLMKVDGFATRFDACEYLLIYMGFRNDKR